MLMWPWWLNSSLVPTEEDLCLVVIHMSLKKKHILFNPIALRKAKIVGNFGLSKCKRVKGTTL